MKCGSRIPRQGRTCCSPLSPSLKARQETMKRTRFLKSLGLLGGLMLAVFLVETLVTSWVGDQTLAPFLSMLCFFGLIFWGSPALILLAAPLLAAESYWLILDCSKYPKIRAATALLGGLLAYFASLQRKSLENQANELDLILAAIQTPWIHCDRYGNIIRMSSQASALAQANINELVGTSFFSKFAAGPSKGELIQSFLKSADSHMAVENVTLTLMNHPQKHHHASFVPLKTHQGHGILVIFNSTLVSLAAAGH